MPKYGLLECAIELGDSNLKLREYGTKYYDRTVETHVAIPSQPTPFGIRLNSYGYIAPGLSIYVFIDGVYQTNRNKGGLEPPTLRDPNSANIEFRLGHKEDLLKEGRVIARGWRFEKLNITAEGKSSVTKDVLDNIGTIEVVVLRCRDNPNYPPVDPWKFPRLPRRDNPNYPPVDPWKFPRLPRRVDSNAQAGNSKNDQNEGKRKTSTFKEPSDDGDDAGSGDIGGLSGLFDGAADDGRLYGLDGQWDSRDQPPYRYISPPRRRVHNTQPSFVDRPEQISGATATKTSSSDDEPPAPRAQRRQTLEKFPDLVRSERRRDPYSLAYYKQDWETSGDEAARRDQRTSRQEGHRSEPERSIANVEDRRLEEVRYQNRQEELVMKRNREKARALAKEVRHLQRQKKAAQGYGRLPHEEQPQYLVVSRDDSLPSPHTYEYLCLSHDEAMRRHGGPTPARAPQAIRAPSQTSATNVEYNGQAQSSPNGLVPWGGYVHPALSTPQVLPGAPNQMIANVYGPPPLDVAWPAYTHSHNRPGPQAQHGFPNLPPGPPQHASPGPPPQHVPVNQVSSWYRPTQPRQFEGHPHVGQHQQHHLQPGLNEPNTNPTTVLPYLAQNQYTQWPHYQYQLGYNQVPQAQPALEAEVARLRREMSQMQMQINTPALNQRDRHVSFNNQNLSEHQGHGSPNWHGNQDQGSQGKSNNNKRNVSSGSNHSQQRHSSTNAQGHDNTGNGQNQSSHNPMPGSWPHNSDGGDNNGSTGQSNHRNNNGNQQSGGNFRWGGRKQQNYGTSGRANVRHSNAQSGGSFGQWNRNSQQNNRANQRIDNHNGNQRADGNSSTLGDNGPGKTDWNRGQLNNGNQRSGDNSAWGSNNQQNGDSWKFPSDQQGNNDNSGASFFDKSTNHQQDNSRQEGVGWNDNGDTNQQDHNSQGGTGWGGNGNKQGNNSQQDNNNQGGNGWGANNHQQDNTNNNQGVTDWGGNNNQHDSNKDNQGGTGWGWENNQQDKTNDNQGETGWDRTDNNKSLSQHSQSNARDNAWDNQNNDQQSNGGGSWGNPSPKTKSNKLRKSKDDRSKDKEPTKPAEQPYTRSYWKGKGSNDNTADADSGRRRESHTLPEEPIYTISKSKAREAHVRHQVRPGKGAECTKKTNSPLYYDNFDVPYTVFRFHYRSREMLKEMLGEDIKESTEEFQERLKVLSKEELIAEMLRKKEAGGWSSDDEDGSVASGAKKEGGNNGGGAWGADTGGKGAGNDAWAADTSGAKEKSKKSTKAGSSAEPAAPKGGW